MPRLDIQIHILGSNVHRDQHPWGHLPHSALARIQENPALKHSVKNFRSVRLFHKTKSLVLLGAFAQDQENPALKHSMKNAFAINFRFLLSAEALDLP